MWISAEHVVKCFCKIPLFHIWINLAEWTISSLMNAPSHLDWVNPPTLTEWTISPWLSGPSHLDWVDHLTLTEWTISPCLSGPYHLIYICPSHIDWVGQYHLGWVHHFTLTEWTVLPWLSGPSSSESLGPRHPSLPLCKTLNNIFIRPSLPLFRFASSNIFFFIEICPIVTFWHQLYER